jgi:hypothetical protein
VLKLFNVSASHFAAEAPDPEGDLQNALARLGAAHLLERTDLVPSSALDEPHAAIGAGLTSGSPRLLSSLAPALVRQIDRVNFPKLRADLAASGLAHRLDWLLENTRDALRSELATAPPPAWAKRYRRAMVLVENALELASPRTPPDVLDILDSGIRSKHTLSDVRAASSPASLRWGIVSSLRPEHFAEALRGAREAG